jgi:hypothetical protein
MIIPAMGAFLPYSFAAIPTGSGRTDRPGVRHGARAAVGIAALMLIVALMLPAAAFSSPRVLEEVARVALPDPSFASATPFVPTRVAVQGDDLIVTGSKVEPAPFSSGVLVQAAFLFERQANGSWVFVMRLGPERRDDLDITDWSDLAAAIDGDVIAIQPRRLLIFERSPAGWVRATQDEPFFDSSDVELSNGTIVVGDSGCSWDAGVVRKNSSGRWTLSATVNGGDRIDCDDNFKGGDVDISGDALIVANEVLDFFAFPSPEARLYERAGEAWPEAARLANFGDGTRDRVRPVAIDGSSAYVGGTAVTGLRVYDRNAAGQWPHTTTIAPADAYTVGEELRVEAEGYVVVAYPNDPYRRGSVAVFQRQSSGRYEQIARLVRSDATPASPDITDAEIDVGPERTTVVLGTAGAAYVYELDDTTQPNVVQDNFQDGNANGWAPSNVNTWTVVTSGQSRAYRQTSFDAESTSVLTGPVWTDQSIEADVIPRAIQGTDRFVGLAVRRSDAANYYYVSLRSSNTLQLRKKVNGTFITLASAPFPFQLGRRYRLRVEAIGSLLRAHVNGVRVLEAVDESHTRGNAALLTWRAQANFDNVVVTPNPLITLFADAFTTPDTSRWTKQFGVWNVSLQTFAQSSANVKGRAIAGISTDDMIVQARARATSALVSGGWFGVMARHIDDRNFYYLRLGDGRVSIRRFLNGAFVELAGLPFTVSSNVTYTLRLEVVGTRLRGYVNNQFYVEANDASHASGRYGLATNLTAVQFDDVRVQQP